MSKESEGCTTVFFLSGGLLALIMLGGVFALVADFQMRDTYPGPAEWKYELIDYPEMEYLTERATSWSPTEVNVGGQVCRAQLILQSEPFVGVIRFDGCTPDIPKDGMLRMIFDYDAERIYSVTYDPELNGFRINRPLWFNAQMRMTEVLRIRPKINGKRVMFAFPTEGMKMTSPIPGWTGGIQYSKD